MQEDQQKMIAVRYWPLLLQIVGGTTPVASLVNWVDGEATYIYGGCVFALASRTNITSLKDLVDMKVNKDHIQSSGHACEFALLSTACARFESLHCLQICVILPSSTVLYPTCLLISLGS